MSVYIWMVTLGFMVARRSSSATRASSRYLEFVVLRSLTPLRISTIAMAVCQSSRIARLSVYWVSQKTSKAFSYCERSTSAMSVRQPMPVE